MRLLVAGGGTGGHVYPALSVVEALLGEEDWGARLQDVAWVGGVDSIEERILAREEMTFYPIATGALRGVNPLKMLRNLGALAKGTLQARKLVAQFRPDAVLATGGYASVPLVLAASSAGCPSLIYLPDVEPGLAVRFLSFFAQKIAVSFQSVTSYFAEDKVVVSGYPVRQGFYTTERATALDTLNLTDEYPILLILGGSRGAHSINRSVQRVIGPLLHKAQVVHVSGHEDYDELNAMRSDVDQGLSSRYHLYSYMYENMIDAFVAADLVVARAGAAVLGELPAAGLPAVLVPYPYAGQHQHVNAEYLAQRGAALIIRDEDLLTSLLPVVSELLDDPQRLAAMREASRNLAVPNASRVIADRLYCLAEAHLAKGKRHG